MVMVGGSFEAHAALEGRPHAGAPPWLSLFGAAIRPTDGAMFIVGAKCLVLTSTDKGKTWTKVPITVRPGGPLFQDFDLYSIKFAPDGKRGVIVGESGTALITDDGGSTWKKVDTGTAKTLLKVYVDDQDVVAVGADGIIVRSTDGGMHWQTAKCPKDITLFDVAFTDTNTGWITGEFETVLKSTDGGQTWNVVAGGHTEQFELGPFFTINFVDSNHAMTAGLAGELSTTDDGGKTWKTGSLPEQIGTYTVAYNPATKRFWTAGAGGRMFAQGADGKWQAVPRVTFNDLTDIAFAGNEGVMVGLSGTILVSDDAGEKWQVVQ